MMADFATVVNDLMANYPYALAAAIIDGSSNVVYSTDNWDVTGDIGKVMAAWRGGNAQFVNIQGIKYVLLQITGERLVGTNFGKQGHLIGASTTVGDQTYYLLAYISPEDEAWNHTAYPSVARAVDILAGGSSIAVASSFEPQPGTGLGGVVSSSPSRSSNIDPEIKANIEGFLTWIKDPQGLAGYISYYLEQNDANIISQLSQVYNEFRRIFNF